MGKVLGSVQVKVTMHKYYSVPLFLEKGDVYTQLERMLENEEIPLSDEFEIEEEVVNAEMLNWAEADLSGEDREDTLDVLTVLFGTGLPESLLHSSGCKSGPDEDLEDTDEDDDGAVRRGPTVADDIDGLQIWVQV